MEIVRKCKCTERIHQRCIHQKDGDILQGMKVSDTWPKVILFHKFMNPRNKIWMKLEWQKWYSHFCIFQIWCPTKACSNIFCTHLSRVCLPLQILHRKYPQPPATGSHKIPNPIFPSHCTKEARALSRGGWRQRLGGFGGKGGIIYLSVSFLLCNGYPWSDPTPKNHLVWVSKKSSGCVNNVGESKRAQGQCYKRTF